MHALRRGGPEPSLSYPSWAWDRSCLANDHASSVNAINRIAPDDGDLVETGNENAGEWRGPKMCSLLILFIALTARDVLQPLKSRLEHPLRSNPNQILACIFVCLNPLRVRLNPR